jgi:iron complex outermembrane recepter protein
MERNMLNQRVTRGLLCAASTFGMLSGVALAQDLQTAGASTNEGDIVVTAQKREERLIDVPGSVAAIGGDQLESLGAANLQDFAAFVPGLNFAGSGPGSNTLIIRGVTTGIESSPLVGVVLDGAPYGSSSYFASGGLLGLDLGLYDLERVEVLKGPQGTLYGASAMGGLISYVTKTPNTREVEGSLDAELNDTEGGELGYRVQGALNVPIAEDKLALRVTAYSADYGAFLDDPLNGERNINDVQIYGGRASLLFKPSEDVTVRLTAVLQNVDRDASDAVRYDFATGQPAFGSLDQAQTLREPFKQRFQQYFGNVDWDVGIGTLSSITSYAKIRSLVTIDASESALGGVSALLGGTSTPYLIRPRTEKFVQELRLTSPGGQRLTWQAGLFYTKEDSSQVERLIVGDSDGRALPDINPALEVTLDSEFEEYAAFANVGYDLTERLNLNLGGRFSVIKQRYTQSQGGLLAPEFGLPPAYPEARSSEEQGTYLATLRYGIDEDNNVYARAASGYRAGGPNVRQPGTTATFGADTLWNYEIGYKGRLLDRRLDVEIAAFYIDWKDIQINRTAPSGFGFRDNAGSASSVGIEGSATLRPVKGLSLTASAAYTDAQLEQAVPELGARKGERLPFVPKWTASLGGDYSWSLSDRLSGNVGGTLRHVGARTVSFDQSVSDPQFRLDAYTLVDLRAGIGTADERYSLNLFVRNLFDERAETSGETGRGFPNITIARPRSYGVSASARF